MKKIAIATMALGLGVATLTANAASEQGGYVGGQINFASVDFEALGFDLSGADPKTLTLLGGWSFNPYIAVEGRLGIDAGSDDYFGDDISIDNSFSVLARGTMPINDMFNVYGLLGFSSVKVKDEFDGGSDSFSDTGLTYGIGAEVTFAEHHGVSIEYGRLIDGSDSVDGVDADLDFEVTALSIGYRYRF